MREQIANIVNRSVVYCDTCESVDCDCSHRWSLQCADEILSITNPVLTVNVTCGKCGGTDSGEPYKGNEPCNHCDNGQVDRGIEWERIYEESPYASPLHLADIVDPDVAYGYWALSEQNGCTKITLRDNKGALRLNEAG